MFSSSFYMNCYHYSFDYSWLYRKTKGVLHRAGKFLLNKYCLPFFFGALLLSNTAFASVIGVSSSFDDLTDYRYTSDLDHVTTTSFVQELVHWNRFDVCERINVNKVLNEQRMSGKQLSVTGLDYLVTGEISDVYTKTKGGLFNPKTAAYATVSISVIDVVNGQIVYTDSEISEVIRDYDYHQQPCVKSRYIADAARMSARTLAKRLANTTVFNQE